MGLKGFSDWKTILIGKLLPEIWDVYGCLGWKVYWKVTAPTLADFASELQLTSGAQCCKRCCGPSRLVPRPQHDLLISVSVSGCEKSKPLHLKFHIELHKIGLEDASPFRYGLCLNLCFIFKFEGVAVLNPTRTEDVNHFVSQGLRYVLHVETTQKPLSQAA